MKIVSVIFTLTIKYVPIIALNCGDIKAVDSAAKFSSSELKSLEEKDVVNCFNILGKDKLNLDQAEALWNHILKIYESAEQIPEGDLRMLGWVAKGIPPNQFLNMSFTDIDTIAAFGRYYELSFDQLSALRDAVMDQWSSKDIPDLSSYDLANLGQILCAFNTSDITRIQPTAYKEAASALSSLKNCSEGVIKGLATLAVNPYSFGDPKKWTPLQVSSIGCVIAGVPQISSIPSEAFKGIMPDIVDCLPQSAFQAMTEAQLSALPATSGRRVGIAGLSGDQESALEQSINQNSGSCSKSATVMIVFAIACSLINL